VGAEKKDTSSSRPSTPSSPDWTARRPSMEYVCHPVRRESPNLPLPRLLSLLPRSWPTHLDETTTNFSKSLKQHLQRRSRHPTTVSSSPTTPTNWTSRRTTQLERTSISACLKKHLLPCFSQNPGQNTIPNSPPTPTSPRRGAGRRTASRLKILRISVKSGRMTVDAVDCIVSEKKTWKRACTWSRVQAVPRLYGLGTKSAHLRVPTRPLEGRERLLCRRRPQQNESLRVAM